MSRALVQLERMMSPAGRKKAGRRLRRMHRYEDKLINAAYGTIHRTLRRTARIIAKALVRHDTPTYAALPDDLRLCVTPEVYTSIELLVRTSLRPRKRLVLMHNAEPLTDNKEQNRERRRRVGIYEMQHEMATEMNRAQWEESRRGPKASIVMSDRRDAEGKPTEVFQSANQAADAMVALSYRCTRQDIYTAMKNGWKCCERKWEKVSGIRQHIPRGAKPKVATGILVETGTAA